MQPTPGNAALKDSTRFGLWWPKFVSHEMSDQTNTQGDYSNDKPGFTRNAYIITGPTSGIGRATALEVARLGTVILVGRDTKSSMKCKGRSSAKAGRRCQSYVISRIWLVCAVRQQTYLIFKFRSLDWSTMRVFIKCSPRKAHRDGI